MSDILEIRRNLSGNEKTNIKFASTLTFIIGGIFALFTLLIAATKNLPIIPTLFSSIISIIFIRLGIKFNRYKSIVKLDKTNGKIKISDNMPIKATCITHNIKDFNIIRINKIKTFVSRSDGGSDEFSYIVALSYFEGDIFTEREKFLKKDEFDKKEEPSININSFTSVDGIKKLFKGVSSKITSQFNQPVNPITVQLDKSKNLILSYFTIIANAVSDFENAFLFAKKISDFLNFPIIDEISKELIIILPNENKNNS